MWALLQILGCVFVTIGLTYQKVNGLCLKSFVVYNVLSILSFSWMYGLSYEKAPSFFSAWFFGTALLAILGFMSSVFYLNESPTVVQYCGAGLALTGGLLLACN